MVTNSRDYIPSSEGNRPSAAQESLRFLLILPSHYRIHNISLPVPLLSYINPVKAHIRLIVDVFQQIIV